MFPCVSIEIIVFKQLHSGVSGNKTIYLKKKW